MDKKIKKLLQSFFPPPRREFSFARLLPLLIFLVLFGITCFLLEFYDVLLYTKPLAFLFLLVTPWVWWMHEAGYSGITGFRAVLALFVRFAVIGVFVMLLTEPRAVRKSDSLSIVYALDLSDSIGGDASDKALEYILRTAQQRPKKDKAGLIVFGGDSAVELPPRANLFPFETVNSKIGKDATNIKKGLSLAAAMLPEGENGRIVLISDGAQTEGALKGVLDELKSRNLSVDVLPVDYEFNDEVWLEKLELPRFVKVGEAYEASVVLSSLKRGKGRLMLLENDRVIHQQDVEFSSGKNRFTMPIYMREPGYYEYVAKIELPKGKDGWKKNNVAINYLYLKGKGKVLLVKDAEGDDRDSEMLVGIIKKSNRELEVIDQFDFPRDAMSLMPYDCIIFVNVPADDFDIVQMQAARDAVYNQGAGFLMVGGKNSFGPGGYHRTPIEDLLPVDMDISNKKVLPKGALVIILHTCEFANGNTWAKRIAKAAIRVLGAKDEVGLLAWDYQGGDNWVFPLTPAEQYEELAKKINNCEPGDMPDFGETMEQGLEGLKKSDAATKHMIIISDGDPTPPTPELLDEFKENKITISTVLVDGFHQGSYQRIMRIIQKETGGKFYYPKNPNQLPSIFIKEAKTLKKSMIQNKVFVPQVEFNDGTLLKGIDTFRKLYAYTLTTPKSDPTRCSVILKGPDKDQMDPVLAVGRYGMGKTAAFTSDLSPNWGKEWMGWSKVRPFIKQLLINISRVSKENSLRLRSYASGNTGVIIVEDFHPKESLLDVGVQIGGPEGKDTSIKLKQVGPRRYRGQFELWGKGRYQVMAVAAGNDRTDRAIGGFVVPYSAEYLRFRSNPIVLNNIAKRTNGRTLRGDETSEELFTQERKTLSVSSPIFDIFLLILACLIPLDVALRRIQIDMYSIMTLLRLNGRRKGEHTETLGALLKRKENIEFKKEDTAPGAPPATSAEVLRDRLKAREEAVKTEKKKVVREKKETKAVEPPDEGVSTTGRLLARKRKRKNDDE